MTTPAPAAPATPTHSYPPSQGGPCVRCQTRTQRYGVGGNPLCPSCREIAEAARAPKKKA
ncbi:hypothetical protein ACPCSP_25255 [Streptomyces cinereoruber]|uniref:hypothetical protein n=1 Tax=Streptomyces cinereoruber TaxID=67260 RepID=UPI00363626EE